VRTQLKRDLASGDYSDDAIKPASDDILSDIFNVDCPMQRTSTMDELCINDIQVLVVMEMIFILQEIILCLIGSRAIFIRPANLPACR